MVLKWLEYDTFIVLKSEVCHVALTQIMPLFRGFKCASSIYIWAKYLSRLSLWYVLPRGPRGLSAEDLQGLSSVDWGGWKVAQQGLGVSTLQRESPVTTVWRSVVECPPLHPLLLFYSSITKKVGKQAVTEQHSTYRSVWEHGGGV